jgi:hypothetical protein
MCSIGFELSIDILRIGSSNCLGIGHAAKTIIVVLITIMNGDKVVSLD